MPPPTPVVLLAALPLGVLAWLVLKTPLRMPAAAWLAALCGGVVAAAAFGLDPVGVAAAVAKGAWTGTWILLIVVPALLLFQVAEEAGALERVGQALAQVAPTPGRRLLLGAWVLPSFLQGAAGFGTPIAVAAPMLVRAGVPPVAAVSACLIGYHWSVTFGSMGSSYFVAVGTTRLGADEAATFAVRVAVLLAVNMLAAALLLLRRSGDARDALGPALALAAVMSGALLATVLVQPALGSTVAGLAGLLAAWRLLPRERPAGADGLLPAAAPYLVLTAAVTVGFGVPPVRDLFARVPALAPSFPATAAAFGHRNAAVAAHQPFEPLGHPALYLLLAAAAAVWIYRRQGWWKKGLGGQVLRAWAARSRPTVLSVVGLTVLAGLMVDSGMVVALADRLAALLGFAYVALAGLVGTAGTILTGSTTASNALLAPLQARAATGLGLPESVLLAAQGAGGNIGNILSPVNILVGAVAVGCAGAEGDVIRDAWRPAAALSALVAAGALVQAALV